METIGMFGVSDLGYRVLSLDLGFRVDGLGV